MSKKLNMIVDVSRCDNCRNCFLATKDEHIGNDFPGYAASQPAQGHNWIDIERKERGSYPIVDASFMPVMCNHCADAPCMKAATGDAMHRRDDGIVIIHPEKSKGQKAIVDACPYGAVSWNEEKQIPQIWVFDAHLFDEGWTQTRAEQCCPTDALKSIKVEDEEMQRIVIQDGLEVLKPELETKPRVYYKNLHLMNSCFVSGSVVANVDGIDECAEGAEVILKQDGNELVRTMTDTFGEFKIDKLEKGSGKYTLDVSSASLGSLLTTFEVADDSLYLGDMILTAG
jgi:Fe-S-cluster-containing dehydrogenase component